MHSIYDVIRKPIISEKSTAFAELKNQYTFEVNPKAHKTLIKQAIEALFKVKVQSVRTSIGHTESKRTATGTRKGTNKKKAIVTIAPGQKIEFYQS